MNTREAKLREFNRRARELLGELGLLNDRDFKEVRAADNVKLNIYSNRLTIRWSKDKIERMRKVVAEDNGMPRNELEARRQQHRWELEHEQASLRKEIDGLIQSCYDAVNDAIGGIAHRTLAQMEDIADRAAGRVILDWIHRHREAATFDPPIQMLSLSVAFTPSTQAVVLHFDPLVQQLYDGVAEHAYRPAEAPIRKWRDYQRSLQQTFIQKP